MCAILGVALLNGSTFTNNVQFGRLLETLFLESENRGRHATGMAFVSKHKVRVLKKNISASKFVAGRSYQQAVRAFGDVSEDAGPIIVLGHCRATTKGSEVYNVNNHPIIADNIVGIHNGVIGNDEVLFNKYMKDHESFKRAGEVDSEIIFRLLNHYTTQRKMNTKTAMIRTTRALAGSYACAFVSRKNPYLLWLMRGNNPTVVKLFGELGLVIFASTELAINKAAIAAGIKESPVNFNMSQHEGIGLNLFSNRITRVDLISKVDKNTFHDMCS